MAWSFGREFTEGTISGLFALPVGRATIAFVKILGAGQWFPLATPALWAIDPAGVPAASWWLVPILPVVATALTCLTWRRLQLDR